MAFMSSPSRWIPRHPFERLHSIRLPLLAAIAVATIAGGLSRRFDPVSTAWTVYAAPVGLFEGTAVPAPNPWSRSIDFRFPTPDVRNGDAAGIQYTIPGLRSGAMYDLHLEIADRYAEAWSGQLELQVLSDGVPVWRWDVGEGHFTGWIPVHLQVLPAGSTLALRIQITVVGNPPTGAGWGNTGPYGVRDVSLHDRARGETLDVSRSRRYSARSRQLWTVLCTAAGAFASFWITFLLRKRGFRLPPGLFVAFQARAIERSRPQTIAWGLFLLALLVRVHYLNAHPRFSTFFSIFGVPFSDAAGWDAMALEVSGGRGFSGWCSIYRPFYSLCLALIYTWTGHSVLAAQIFNTALGVLTAPLIYLLGRQCLGASAGLAAALFYVIDPLIQSDTLCLMTEVPGLFFLVAALYCFIQGLVTPRIVHFAFAGILLSLSNLTRPLTLPALLPLIVLMPFLLRDAPLGRRGRVPPTLLFLAASVLTLTPWLIRQRVVNGIWTLSYNATEAFYAATSPSFRAWTGREWLEAEKAGAHSLQQKYEYFNRGALQNIRRNPAFYAANVRQSLGQFLANYSPRRANFGTYLLAFLVILYFLPRLGLRAGWWFVASGLALALAILLFLPSPQAWLVCLVGLLGSAVSPQRRASLVLASCLLSSAVASSALAHGNSLGRLYPVLSWLMDLYFFFGLVALVRFVAVMPRMAAGRVSCRRGITRPVAVPRPFLAAWVIAGVVVIFAGVGSIRLLWGTHISRVRGDEVLKLRKEGRAALFDQLEAKLPPNLVSRREALDAFEYVGFAPSSDDDVKLRGKLVFGGCRLAPHIYRLNAGESWRYDSLFDKRDYDWSVVSTDAIDGRLTGHGGFAAFPGSVPPGYEGRAVVLLGRIQVNPKDNWVGRKYLELLAIIPCRDGKALPDEALIARDPRHLARFASRLPAPGECLHDAVADSDPSGLEAIVGSGDLGVRENPSRHQETQPPGSRTAGRS